MKNLAQMNEKYWKSSELWPRRIAWLTMGYMAGIGTMLSLFITLQADISALEQGNQILREAGIEHIEIREGLWGPMLYDPRMESQKGRAFDSVHDAINAALAGERPSKMEVVKNKN